MTALAESQSGGYEIPPCDHPLGQVRERKERRMAIMRVGVELLESLLPLGYVLSHVADKIGAVNYGVLHKALLLPENCRIDAVSMAVKFFNREVCIRVECDDFCTVQYGCCIPEVDAFYGSREVGGKLMPFFHHWHGIATRDGYRWRDPADEQVGDSWNGVRPELPCGGFF